jgi:two-component system chemotaxis response regulator CheB
LDAVRSADVVVLEARPSRIDTLVLVKRLTQDRSAPLIVIAEGAEPGSSLAIDLLNAGALDVLPRPRMLALGAPFGTRVVNSVRLVRRLRRTTSSTPVSFPTPQDAAMGMRLPGRVVAAVRSSPEPKAPPTGSLEVYYHPRQVLLIGASTGGTEAIKSVLTRLPREVPGICIVQHIPAAFSRSFATRLNALCAFEVREAREGDILPPGLALVAPGGHHMELAWRTDRYVVRLHQGPEEHHQRPAVDVLFRSAAQAAGRHALAVLLTGMGRDGATGMKSLREAGGTNIAQDGASCVVFGMPAAAIELGVVDQVASLEDMPQAILRRLAAIQRSLAGGAPGEPTSLLRKSAGQRSP